MKTNIFENLYKDVFLTEMKKKYIEMVNEIRDDLPFDNIFGTDLRVIVPFSENSTYDELKTELSKINGFVSFDPNKKEVVRQIKIKTPAGEGIKNQVLGVGKAISTLKIPDEKKKAFLNWFSNYSSNIGELEELSKYVIVLSRHPVDVIRMSDAGSISSCHSEGGMYFKCAIQEAKTGGPIAYLVEAGYLKVLSEVNFQTDEIFADRDRSIRGIIPLARLRIRRYQDSNGNDYAIPEERIYGSNIAGFSDTVIKFLKEKQPELLANVDTIAQKFKTKKIYKKGGSYSDTSDSSLFNNFFGVDAFGFGTVKHTSDDLEEEGTEDSVSRAEQFEEELRDFQDSYAGKLEHSGVGYNVEVNDDYVYYDAWGFTSIDLRGIGFGETEFPDMNDPSDFRFYLDFQSTKNKEYENYRTKNMTPEDKNYAYRISSFLNKFIDYSGIDKYDISHMRKSYNSEGILEIIWTFGDGEGGNSDNTDDFRTLCRTVGEYDKQYDDIRKAFIKALYISKLLVNPDATHVDSSVNFVKFQNDELTLNYFGAYDEEGFQGVIGLNLPMDEEKQQDINVNETYFTHSVARKIEAIYKEYLANKKPNGEQLKFNKFMESLTKIEMSQPVSIDTTINYHSSYGTGVEYPELMIDINPDVITSDFVDFMVMFDQQFESFANTYVKGLILYYIRDELLDDNQRREKTFLRKHLM